MRLLTTDLDRTFIFSERTVNCAEQELVCIETLDGRNLSYISRNVLDTLQQLNDQQLVIPVTTRSLQQYERIELFQQVYRPKYSIVANGGIVLKNGERDTQWDEIIASEMSQSLSFQELALAFKDEWSHPMFRRITDANQLFYVLMLVEEHMDVHFLEDLTQQLQKNGWKSYINGRKFYILPKNLTKERAVQYVLQQQPYNMHLAAGDSCMDLGMLQLAQRAFTPKHGSLYENFQLDAHIETPNGEGVMFTEELLQSFVK